MYTYGAHPSKMAHTHLDCAPSAHNLKILELFLIPPKQTASNEKGLGLVVQISSSETYKSTSK